MLRIFMKFNLWCAALLFSTSILASQHYLAGGMSIDYELPPHASQEFVNIWLWSITSTCTIHTKDLADDVLIESLKKTSTINGILLAQGDNILLTVHEGDKVVIAADSGSKVKITNHGESTILASCAT